MLDMVVWSKPSTYSEGTGVHHGYATAKQTAAPTGVSIEAVSGDVRNISNAWYAKLDSGGFIVPHIDQGPWRERWHYPLSGQGYVWQDWNPDDNDRDPHFRFLTMRNPKDVQVPYRMNHHKPHAVWNPYDEPRIILIVEYDNLIDQPTTDLIICDMIPEIQTMIDAI